MTNISNNPQQHRYTPKTIFRVYPALFLVATLWLGSETWKRHSIIWLIMFIGVAFITLRLILSAFAWAEFDGDIFIYHTPLRPPHHVRRGQLALVEMGGRRNEALIIGYHLLDENGHIDPDKMRYINCPPLTGQGELMDRLLAAMPAR